MAFLDIIDAFMLYYLIGAFWSESVRISIRTIDTGHFADVLMAFKHIWHVYQCSKPSSGPGVAGDGPISRILNILAVSNLTTASLLAFPLLYRGC